MSMFGSGIHVIQNGSTLTFNVPLHWLAILLGSFFWLVIPQIFRPGHLIRNVLIGAALAGIYGFLLSSTQLILNRSDQTATLREFTFYHWSTRTFPLANVNGILLHSGNSTSRLDLQLTDGSIHPLTFQDQFTGKEKVQFQINTFLAGH